MDNNYCGTPVLDEILGRRKELAGKTLTRQLIVCGIIGLILTIACIVMTSDIADYFACWILPGILAGCHIQRLYALPEETAEDTAFISIQSRNALRLSKKLTMQSAVQVEEELWLR